MTEMTIMHSKEYIPKMTIMHSKEYIPLLSCFEAPKHNMSHLSHQEGLVSHILCTPSIL